MIGNMRTENKNHGLEVGSKLIFLLCTLVSCFNHVATVETSHLQNGNEKINLRSEQHRALETEDEGGAFKAILDIDLKGNEDVLKDSDYLIASFEQIVKDYINNDIKCENESEETSTAYTSMKINFSETNKKKLAIAGSGKCLGRRRKCFRLIKQTKPERLNTFNLNSINQRKDLFCENFRESTIFALFQDVIVTASFYKNYFIDIDILRDTAENVDLKYEVSFEQVDDNALGELNNIRLDLGSLEETDTICDDVCTQQKETMREIFSHFDVQIVENQHECAYEGINCNDDERVTQIWMGRYKNSNYIFAR